MANDKHSDILLKCLVADVELKNTYADRDDPRSYSDRMTRSTQTGSIFLQRGMYFDALTCFLRAYAERRDDFWARSHLGSMALEANNPSLANYFLRDCLEEAPEDWSGRPKVLTNLASCQLKLGDFSGAEASLEEAIKIDPSLDRPYYMKSIYHIYTKNLEQALADARKGLEKSPQSYLLKHLELHILEIMDDS